MKWPEWLTYCPRSMTRAQWKEEFERNHRPKYEAREREIMRELKSGSYWKARSSDLIIFLMVGAVALIAFLLK